MKKTSNSSTNLQNNRKLNIDSNNTSIKKSKSRPSVQNFLFHEKIYDKLNEGTVFRFLCESSKKNEKKNINDFSENSTEMDYDLSMINKYKEDCNLSFISDFDLEKDDDANDSSFNSSLDGDSMEEIEIEKKSI